jgi:hypothetical protein
MKDRITELEQGLKRAICLFYLDKPVGMTDYEFSSFRGQAMVKLSNLVKWEKGEKPFSESK